MGLQLTPLLPLQAAVQCRAAPRAALPVWQAQPLGQLLSAPAHGSLGHALPVIAFVVHMLAAEARKCSADSVVAARGGCGSRGEAVSGGRLRSAAYASAAACAGVVPTGLGTNRQPGAAAPRRMPPAGTHQQ